jgi:hypothetical protein
MVEAPVDFVFDPLTTRHSAFWQDRKEATSIMWRNTESGGNRGIIANLASGSRGDRLPQPVEPRAAADCALGPETRAMSARAVRDFAGDQ